MGKKTRPGTGGRRTIIQLSPICPRTTVAVEGNVKEEALGSASDDDQEGSCDGHKLIREEPANMRNPAVKPEGGLSLLGAYEDSDDEDTDSQTPIVRPQHNQAGEIDVLASFLAEIDAITTQPGSEEPPPEDPQPPAPTPPRPEPKAQQPDVSPTVAAVEQSSSTSEFHYDTQCSLAGVGVDMGDWQEVWDENTGCYYYWNTIDNQVVWELPLDLSKQVQMLRQSYESAIVNGNGTAPPAALPENYPEQNSSTSTSTLAPKKKKEVMESVVALTSEEEERRGVAASLLAPLIPSEVKEAEEKWRKRLLGGLEEENSMDSDAGLRLPGSPAVAALRDPDSQRGQRSSNQSKENSDAEEEAEPEEDTMELELALERKKAELRALEEGDGSAGGSSPCSEASASQEAPGPLQKKARWKTAFVPAAASPDSNSRESDTPDNTETVAHSPEKTVKEEEEEETDGAEEKTVAKALPKEEVETPELKFQIGELANTLTNKMEFLGINRKAISNFQLLLLQTEMRIADWREGALNGIYLRRKLQEAAEHIKHYELNAAPKGWSCHWDREHRRYFYTNDRTSASQWDFPVDEEEGDEEQKGNQTPPEPRAASQGEAKPPVVAPSDRTTGLSSTSAPAVSPQPALWASPPQQPPLPPDQPPPPSDYPPPPPPPESPPPPPPPPDSDDGEIMEVEMEDEEGEPPAPGTEEDGSLRMASHSGSASTKTAEPSLSLGKGQKRKASGAAQPSKAVVIGSSPILYTQTAVAAAPVMSGTPYWSVPVVAPAFLPAEAPAPPLPPPPAQPPLPPCQPPSEPPGAKTLPTEKTKKPKKEKKSKTKMPSLVQKWQNIQRELDEEEKESSSDEDRDQLNKRSIEEWKQQQLTTGKAGKNANFEALPGDWRERVLKKRKMMKSK